MSGAGFDVANFDVQDWANLGMSVQIPQGNVFTIDLTPDVSAELAPVVVLHGFPTSSFDWRHVLEALGRGDRRVVLFDFLGFGLSEKPDRHYGIDLHAETTIALLSELGIRECVLVTHDMGDTVGGEVLARIMRDPPASRVGGEVVDLSVVGRIVSNGSIYLEMANLTDGQRLLWAADDTRIADELGVLVGGEGYAAGLAKVFAPNNPPDEAERAAQIALMEFRNGHLLLPRLIRYLDDRKQHERRYTGAIEVHPSPLAILWAQRDPVAIAAMGEQLLERRPDASMIRFDDLGHYPMIESPDRFGAALRSSLQEIDALK